MANNTFVALAGLKHLTELQIDKVHLDLDEAQVFRGSFSPVRIFTLNGVQFATRISSSATFCHIFSLFFPNIEELNLHICVSKPSAFADFKSNLDMFGNLRKHKVRITL